jgi:hypothetical protein
MVVFSVIAHPGLQTAQEACEGFDYKPFLAWRDNDPRRHKVTFYPI